MPLYPDTRPYKPEQASVFDSPLTSAIHTFLKMTGLANPQDQVLAPMGAMEVGPSGGVAGAIQKFIKAYHGSPHDFDQFSLDKIGTGEGAQAYGHGLYFAENQDVATDYQKKLSGLLPEGWSQRYPDSARGYIRGVVGDVADGKLTADQAAKYVYNANSVMREYPSAQLAAEIADAAEKTKGRMYEVAIHASPDQLLDWDQPLSQQSEHVQKAVGTFQRSGVKDGMPLAGGGTLRIVDDPDFGQKFFLEMNGKRFTLQPGDVRNLIGSADEGKAVYQSIRSSLGSDSETSRALSAAGIPGLKYLDGGSRAAGEGSHNYVIWDESKVEILKKYGIALPVIEAMRREAMANGGKIEVQ